MSERYSDLKILRLNEEYFPFLDKPVERDFHFIHVYGTRRALLLPIKKGDHRIALEIGMELNNAGSEVELDQETFPDIYPLEKELGYRIDSDDFDMVTRLKKIREFIENPLNRISQNDLTIVGMCYRFMTLTGPTLLKPRETSSELQSSILYRLRCMVNARGLYVGNQSKRTITVGTDLRDIMWPSFCPVDFKLPDSALWDGEHALRFKLNSQEFSNIGVRFNLAPVNKPKHSSTK